MRLAAFCRRVEKAEHKVEFWNANPENWIGGSAGNIYFKTMAVWSFRYLLFEFFSISLSPGRLLAARESPRGPIHVTLPIHLICLPQPGVAYMYIHRVNSFLCVAFATLAMCATSRAAVVEIYTENLDAFDAAQDLGDGIFYAVQTIADPPSPFMDGNAIRMFDFSTEDKPELQGELAAPLLEPFQFDFQSFDNSPTPSGSAIRFRLANSGSSISSESRSALSLSWQADGEFTAKYNGSADGSITDVDTTSSEELVGVQNISMIANGALAGTYTYNAFGVERTLNPLSYDIYINGVLLNDSMEGDTNHDDFKNGLLFHDRPTDSFDASLGIQRFGLIGSSNSNTDPDVFFDNIILRTGDDITAIPEPASVALGLAGLVLIAARRRFLA